jgi:hypothetical protein
MENNNKYSKPECEEITIRPRDILMESGTSEMEEGGEV